MTSIALERAAARIAEEDSTPLAGATARWFADLYHDTADRVFRFACVLTHDRCLAEDVVAETYLRIWRARDRFDPTRSELAWAMAIARNCAMDLLRARRFELVGMDYAERIEDPSFDYSVDELTPEQLELLRRAVARLTAEQQQVIFLRFFEGMNHEGVARQMGKKPNAIRAIQFRALARLRTLLGAHDA